MSSKDLTPNRPLRTYTLDSEGKIVKSQGLKNFTGAINTETQIQHELQPTTSSPGELSYSFSDISSLYSSDFEYCSSSAADDEDVDEAAADLLDDLDDIMGEDKPRSRKQPFDQYTKPANLKPESFKPESYLPESLIKPSTSRAYEEEKAKVEVRKPDKSPEVISESEESDSVSFPMPAGPDGMMAIRLPPIRRVQLEDVFHKQIRKEDIFNPAIEIQGNITTSKVRSVEVKVKAVEEEEDEVDNTRDATSWLKRSKPDRYGYIASLPGQPEVVRMRREVTRRVTMIDTQSEPQVTSVYKKKGSCLRNLLCGLSNGCGEDVEEFEVRRTVVYHRKSGKSPNCFQRAWKRLRELF